MDEVIVIISNIGLAILVVNTLVYFTGFTQNSKAYKFLCLYLLCSSIVQIIMFIMAYSGYNNLFLSGYHLFTQFILLSCFFYSLFKPLSKIKSITVKYVSIIVTTGLIVQYFFDPELYYNFNPTGFLITSLLLITYAVLYIYELLTQKLLFNFVTIGAFIYLTSSCVIFTSSTSMVSLSQEMFSLIWQINAVLFIIYQLLIFWEWKQHFLPKKIK
ncbi:hypothetical protein GR160_06085 [Flavobacterium sp. Sd200]|uniref:hypothetical protein n=1 Tax=Flavobacterium sp. Sd200 TaxID=2692211 RepID=UPI00136ED730|nr:hypothetical protein [Flavobacterium sp. Sd200]MXN90790.1 hypothetical protein [Flavobacterium sp. Sd200]